MDHQAELVGGRLGAGGTIRREVKLMGLDQILGLSACALDVLVEMLGSAGEIGDDEAGVDALRSGLDAGDDTPAVGVRPCRPPVGGIGDFTVAAHLLGGGFKAAKRYILGKIGDLAQQHAVAGEPEDVADAVPLVKGDGLDAAIVAVATNQNLLAWPAGTNVADEMT